MQAHPSTTRLLLAGDVMTGRGIDQVLPHSVAPGLHEPYVKDARVYRELAEEASGPIPAPVSVRYPWGDLPEALRGVPPDVRVINLETAVTDRGEPWPGKGIHYRMHPGNVGVVTAVDVDVCVLGNNHVLDWGREGLADTLRALRSAGVTTCGAGADRAEASAPAVVEARDRRVLVFSFATPGAGVPRSWSARADRPGVHLLEGLGDADADGVAEEIALRRREGDLVIVSIHWGKNWGYEIPAAHRRFARTLIDAEATDVVHGHSSHHPRGIEVYRDRPILYGAGDLLNDYEGIGGQRAYRSELSLAYLPALDPSGVLASLVMVPFRIEGFRLRRADREEVAWLERRMDRECGRFGGRVEADREGRLVLRRD